MDKDKELSKLKKKIYKLSKNFPKKNLVFASCIFIKAAQEKKNYNKRSS